MWLEPHTASGLHVRAGLFSVQLLAGAQHPPWAQMLAHWPPQPHPASLASHLSLAISLHGWPAGMKNQPLMGLRGLEEGMARLVGRMKVPGGRACTDWQALTLEGPTAQAWHPSFSNHEGWLTGLQSWILAFRVPSKETFFSKCNVPILLKLQWIVYNTTEFVSFEIINSGNQLWCSLTEVWQATRFGTETICCRLYNRQMALLYFCPQPEPEELQEQQQVLLQKLYLFNYAASLQSPLASTPCLRSVCRWHTSVHHVIGVYGTR